MHGRTAGAAVYTEWMRTPIAIAAADPAGAVRQRDQAFHRPARDAGQGRGTIRGALLLGTLLAATSWTAPALAQWKWRDATGQVTASDRPPPKEIPDKDILTRPQAPGTPRRSAAGSEAPPAGAATAAAATAASAAASVPRAGARGGLAGEVEARRQAAAREAAAKAAAQEQKDNEQRAENCQRARSHLAALDSGQRISRFNDKGEREVLDDKGRADESRRARETIAANCR